MIDHRFRSTEGTIYAFIVIGPEALPEHMTREPLVMAVRSFCLKGMTCSKT
ncbi:hypothetical protein [Streptomyces sp. NPDC002685]|uniref:hypothetical protein n=1 Tax=Streptomyces sp. NPDC002685 TaxID=3154540 RepID=UPI00332C79A9